MPFSFGGPLIKNSLWRSMHRKQNHYEILKLNKTCNQKEIKEAYYHLSKKYHPDRNNSGSSKMFLEVAEAYKTLSKPNTRFNYDMSLLPEHERYKADHYKQFHRRQMDEPAFYRPRSYNYEYDRPPRPGMRQENKAHGFLTLLVVLCTVMAGFFIEARTLSRELHARREAQEKKLQSSITSSEKLPLIVSDKQNHEQIKLLE